MSTPITDKTAATAVIPCASCFVVEKGRPSTESLADYVRRIRNEKNLSLVDVSVRSRGAIGRTHINRIENGLTTNPSPRKLRALAQGLSVPEDEVFAVARGRIPANQDDADEQRMLFAYRDLDPGQKKSALRILEALRGADMEPEVKPNERRRKRRGSKAA